MPCSVFIMSNEGMCAETGSRKTNLHWFVSFGECSINSWNSTWSTNEPRYITRVYWVLHKLVAILSKYTSVLNITIGATLPVLFWWPIVNFVASTWLPSLAFGMVVALKYIFPIWMLAIVKLWTVQDPINVIFIILRINCTFSHATINHFHLPTRRVLAVSISQNMSDMGYYK